MDNQVTQYIDESTAQQKEIMQALRALIHKRVPNVVENFKWGRPVFSTTSDFAYFKTNKAYLSLGFFKFNKIQDQIHLLEGTGKDMRHIKIRKLEDLKSDLMAQWIDSTAS